MAKVLVTGANGHIGSNLVRQLLDRKDDVVPLVRETSDLRTLKGLRVKPFIGDVMNAESMVEAATGCDVIYHTAAVFRPWARDPNDILAPALQGTANAFKAADAVGAKRLVYTSSCIAVGFSDGPKPRNEEQWADDVRAIYIRSKLESERLAHDLAAKSEVEMVAVLPAMVLGPWDYRVTPSSAYLRDLINGDMPIMKGGLSLVDVEDVAKAHIAAAEKGKPGGRYIVAGENVTNDDIATALERLTEQKLKRLSPPKLLMFAIASVAELRASLTKTEPALTRDVVRDYVGKYAYFENRRLRTELGITPRPTTSVIKRAIAWLLHIDQIKPEIAQGLAEKFPVEEIV